MNPYSTRNGRLASEKASDAAAGQREQADVAALVGEGRQLVHVLVSIDVAGQVGPPKIEEHAFDEQVDELIEQPTLQRIVAGDELERAEDIVLLGAHTIDQPVLCIHDLRVRQRFPCSLPHIQIFRAEFSE